MSDTAPRPAHSHDAFADYYGPADLAPFPGATWHYSDPGSWASHDRATLAAAAGLIPADHPQLWSTHDLAAAARRTPPLAMVLQAVRDTGRSAHPAPGQRVSDLVLELAGACVDPMVLQRLVDAYGRALRS